jgi:hypothetical protein
MSTTISGVDYGPLAGLVGNWSGDKGLDVAPEPDGQQETPYYETFLFEAIGDVTNAESQTLAVLRYHQVVTRKSDDQVFHNETGYWMWEMWDASSGVVMHSLTIPRGVCVLAGGSAHNAVDGGVSIKVEADIENPDWGIIQSPFMQQNARTIGFRQSILLKADEFEYTETTVLDIYGKIFDHTDGNTLKRV